MPIPHIPVPPPSKLDLFKAIELSQKVSSEEEEIILNLLTDSSTPASSVNRILDVASLRHLTREGIITNNGGSFTLTYIGKVVRYWILLEREGDEHPEWSEPDGWLDDL